MTAADLGDHRGEWVQPLRATYRNVEVVELPPNTQGITALEALKIVEACGPLPPDGPDRQHLLIEAVKMALSDRNAYVTDPDRMQIQVSELTSPAWCASARLRSILVAPGKRFPGSDQRVLPPTCARSTETRCSSA